MIGKPLLEKNENKLISCQTVFQICILLIVFFFGHMFIPESVDDVDGVIKEDWSAKYHDVFRTTVCWGAWESILTEENVYNEKFDKYGIHSRHLTIVFNIYALMQLFNYFNCRKIE